MLDSARFEATRPIKGRFATSRSPAAPNTQRTRPPPASATPRATLNAAWSATPGWAAAPPPLPPPRSPEHTEDATTAGVSHPASDVQRGLERYVGVSVVHDHLEAKLPAGDDSLKPSRHLPHLPYGPSQRLLPHP